ncbi:MAG: type I secretion system permease/ATPase, partial [Mesorhizobium sp.]
VMEKVDKVLVLNRGQQDLFGPRDYVFNELANRAGKVAQMPKAAQLPTLEVVKEVKKIKEVKEA